MRFNNMDRYNELRKSQLFYGLIAVGSALVVGYITLGLVGLITWLVNLVVQYWKWILGGILGLILLRKFFGRKKKQ